MEPMNSALIVRVNAILTAIFIASAVLSAVIFDQPYKNIAVVVSLVVFSAGVVAFLWGYWSAVQRSREDNIAVAALYFLADGCAPKAIALRMNALLGLQFIVALATAISRPSTNGEPGSTLAFGILVPMLGLGLNGLWGALHGTFTPRADVAGTVVPPAEPKIVKDSGHD